MNDDRVDLSPLDPTADRADFERIVDSILARATNELNARRERLNPIEQVVRWWRPVLTAATVATIISVGVLAGVRSPVSVEQTAGMAEAVGVPSMLARGIRDNAVPTAAELFVAFQAVP